MHTSKYISAEKAVQLVKNNVWIDYSFCLGMPYTLDKALAARKDTLHGVKVRGGIVLRPLAILEEDPQGEHFSYHSWHSSAYERALADKGLCDYIPLAYQNMPFLYEKICDVDVAFISVCPMDKEGYFNFSLTNSATHNIIKKAKLVVLEINENLPSLGGKENAVHISEVDYVVEGENPPLPTLPSPPASPSDLLIAEHVLSQISDGAVIQLGIGALPNAIGEAIANSNLQNLGGHTEMLVDSYMTMMQSGRMNNLSKSFDKGKTAFTFGVGTKEFYDWLVENPDLFAPHPVSYTNNASIMSKHEQMISINSCLHIDLFGQISAESVGKRHISGSGGQQDFCLGAMQSARGKGFICCASARENPKTGKLISNIVPSLQDFTIVTSSRAVVHYFATEWGIVELAGQGRKERARRIISVAHPEFRDELTEQAREIGLKL